MNRGHTSLLVSVRSGDEAAIALAGGAHVIDVKEPDRGALGAADPLVWRQVLEAVAGRVPVSAALGELFEGAADPPVAALAAQTGGLSFAKIGLAGAASAANWPAVWQQALAALPPSVSSVAVAYADWQAAGAPPPADVIERGAELGCQFLLFDTFCKSRGHLLDHQPVDVLASLFQLARQRGMKIVLAGSLTLTLFPRVLPLGPALVAVRGAACRGTRGSPIDAGKVRALAAALSRDSSAMVSAGNRMPLGA